VQKTLAVAALGAGEQAEPAGFSAEGQGIHPVPTDPSETPGAAPRSDLTTQGSAPSDSGVAPVSGVAPGGPNEREPSSEADELGPPDIEASGSDSSPYDDEPVENGFAALGLSDELVRAVTDAGYLVPTPIQEQAIPTVLMGRDVLGSAQTGTGKTASFVLPILDILSSGRARARMPRSLILEPTRELAAQVGENFVKYAKYLRFEHALIIGGESMDEQVAKLTRGVDVLIATPGRLIDLFDRGGLILSDTKLLVIDEADRMLDMGFIPDVERIVSMLPRMRQTLFFSATMAPEIRRLADAFLQNPKVISVSKPATVATTVTTGLVLVAADDKREAIRRLLGEEDVKNALIFCNRKRDVDMLYKSLQKHGFNVGALHGDLPQSKRTETLEKFKTGKLAILVCSDVAARGIDIGGLSHVFNFDVPHHAEDYVHRIGRTGRAGREGRAFTLGTPEEAKSIAAIERLTGKPIPRIQLPGVAAPSLYDAADLRPSRDGRPPREGRRDRDRFPRDRTEPRAPRPEPIEALPPEAEAAVPEPRAAEPRAVEPRHVAPKPSPPTVDRPESRRAEPKRADRRAGEPVRPTSTRTPPADLHDNGKDAPVQGFGSDIPAFMLIPIPLPKRSAATDDADA